MPTFQNITTSRKGDTLDGEPLQDQEKLIIRWGDGTSSSHRVSVEKGVALLVLMHKGMEIKVPLRGTKLFMVRDV